jgi:hypothetical protein
LSWFAKILRRYYLYRTPDFIEVMSCWSLDYNTPSPQAKG